MMIRVTVTNEDLENGNTIVVSQTNHDGTTDEEMHPVDVEAGESIDIYVSDTNQFVIREKV